MLARAGLSPETPGNSKSRATKRDKHFHFMTKDSRVKWDQ